MIPILNQSKNKLIEPNYVRCEQRLNNSKWVIIASTDQWGIDVAEYDTKEVAMEVLKDYSASFDTYETYPMPTAKEMEVK